ncbi:MAG: type 4b pilus protein PilO2 [Nitrospiraceae bacterium]|nr:type 4b pilus protein PilO2 [Nitrospiraceae bacterium]
MAQVVRIGKKKYAVGLSWGPLSPDRPLRAQAIEKTRNSKNDLFVTAGDIEPMVGHCDQGSGVKAGLPVLAPLVADVWPANTLIALAPDGQPAIGFQILNGIIYDDVAGSVEEIRAWFDGLVGEHKWDYVSSPWGGNSAGISAFGESLRTSGMKPPKLHSVNEGRGAAIKATVLILLVLAGFAVVSKIVRDRRELVARLVLDSRHMVIRVTPPARIVPIGAFVAGCLKAIDRIPSEAAGWTVQGISCRPDKVWVLWRRSFGSGTIRDLEKTLSNRVKLVGKNRAKTGISLSVPKSEIPVEKLPDLEEEQKDLASVLEYYNLDYQSDGGSFLPGLSGRASARFSVELPDIPGGGLLSALGSVNGLSVRELDWAGKSQWILKGELKHAPIILVRDRSGGRSGSGNSGTGGSGPSGQPEFAVPSGKPGRNSVRERQLGSVSGHFSAGTGQFRGPNEKRTGNAGSKVLPSLRLSSSAGGQLSGSP